MKEENNTEKEFKYNQYKDNPRETNDTRLNQLESNLRELGDLSGVVHEVNTDQIICGNQRTKLMKLSKENIEILERFEKPDEQGTIAIGFIIYQGNKYNFRQVSWTEEQIKKAAIIANVHAGFWDFDALGCWDSDFLKENGFSDLDLDSIFKEKGGQNVHIKGTKEGSQGDEGEDDGDNSEESSGYMVFVSVENEEECKKLYDELIERGFSCKTLAS